MVSNEMNQYLQEAQSSVATLFELMGISRVVVVDDTYSASTNIEEILGSCISLANAGKLSIIQNISHFQEISLPNNDNEILRKRLEPILANLNDGDRKSIAVQLADESDEIDDGEDLTRTMLEELLDGYEVLLLSLEEWNERKKELLSHEFADQTLFLFDQDMTGNGGRENEGVKIIADLLRSNDLPDLRCGLLSHTVPADHEFDTWSFLVTEHDIELQKDRFAVVSKAHLKSDLRAFAFRLKRVAIAPRCNALKKIVCEVIESAHEEAKQQLDSLNVYDFEQIVFQSSVVEGVWEPDTLIRIFNLFHRQAARKKAKVHQDLQQKAEEVRKVVTLPFKPADAPKSTSCSIRRMELYEDGEYVNSYHSPIELGDIFQKTKGNRKFVLIGQPCDLMVRSNGKRDGLCEVVLAEITTKKGNYPTSIFELPYFDPDTDDEVWIRFNNAKTVPLEILDLCVLQNDGVAKVGIEQSCPKELIPAWKSRFDILQEKHNEIHLCYANLIESKPTGNTKDLLERYFLEDVPGIVKGSINTRKKETNYDLKRIGRVKEPLASTLLRHYAAYLARDAFDHDFTRQIPKKVSAS